MEQEVAQIRDQQKEMWNRFSPGWKKWDELTMDFLKPVGDEIIRLLNPQDGDLILDVASGTGEPALTIATMVGSGKVIGTDIAEGMLAIARENALLRGIKNFETQVCDVTEMPFETGTFDAVSCRFGFMFFPDMQLAANEMARVLKRGGRVATSVWNVPEKNFWVTAIMSVISKNMQLPSPPPDAPSMFRCAHPGLIAGIFRKAGFNNICETEVSGTLNCGTVDTYWNLMNDVAAPVVAALSQADDAWKQRIKNEVFTLITERYPDGKVMIDSNALVIYGQK